MSSELLTALLVGGATFVGAIFAAFRAFKSEAFQQRVNRRAGVIAEYEAIIRRLNEQHALDRQQWLTEEAERRERWERERSQLLERSRHQEEEIETLKAQVYALMSRVPTSRTRREDRGSTP